ncbi:DNA-directed RNA polymerase subunit alpha [bacterium]|nr:DNA-directed RNA polymerase subunit alpha [bacterium]MBU1153603.1 DNA-directed RNA polymerase subunit alpha [bacterium]
MRGDELKKLINKSRKIEWDEKTLTNYYGKFTISPFAKGMAITIGNSLRRMFLSSIKGAAVTSIRIEGVLHEFTTIPGVVEDMSEIILNLKKLVVKLNDSGPQKIYIKKKGAGEIKGCDIICNDKVEVISKDLHIADLNEDADLSMELEVDEGYGYVSAERNKTPGQPLGVIPIDSIFTPVNKISFSVEEVRVEHWTDFEKLMLEIHTNGCLSPKDALTQTAKNLRDLLALFIDEEEVMEERIEEETEEEDKLKAITAISIEELELSVRAANCLRGDSITTLGELAKKTEQDMLKTRNFGKKSLNEIKEKLALHGLTLGMKEVT